ncbi:hypothetical protein OIU76_025092 [Salix suchowensis]|nr:hypothetical protein OIU76_025092 [Salix suchowensis]
MGEGEEHGLSKLLIFGLARIYKAPLKALSDNGVVVTIWYRAPELLLGAKHYTSAIDMGEAKSTPNPFQLNQLDKIFKVLGHPTLEKWPTLASLPHWHSDMEHIQGHKYENTRLHSVVPLSPKGVTFDLLSKMLEYHPRKYITAAQALEHDYFRNTNTDFEGTTSLQPPQPVSSGNAVSGGIPSAHGVNNRSAPRPMAMGMQRMQTQGMVAYNLASQAGMGGGMNPGNIPMPCGVAQPHQQHHLRRNDPPGAGTGYSP